MVHFAKSLQNHQVAEWAVLYVDYKALKKLAKKCPPRPAAGLVIDPTAPPSSVVFAADDDRVHVVSSVRAVSSSVAAKGIRTTLHSTADRAEFEFFEKLDNAVTVANEFYSSRVGLLETRVNQLCRVAARFRAQLDESKAAATAMSGESTKPGARWRGTLQRYHNALRYASALPGTDQARLAKCFERGKALRRVAKEIALELSMLESFRAYNKTAVEKILKKHDKLTGWDTAYEYARGLDGLRIASGHADVMGVLDRVFLSIEVCIERLRSESKPGTIKAGSRPLLAHDRRRQLKKLSAFHHTSRGVADQWSSSLSSVFTSGFTVGAATILLGLALISSASKCARSDEECKPVVQTLTAMRMLALLALHGVLYAATVAVWQHFHVNYGFIFFGNDQGAELRPAKVGLAAGLGAIVVSASMTILLLARLSERATRGISLALLAITFVPLPERAWNLVVKWLPLTPPNQTRWYYADTLRRIVCAPIYSVRFPDVFLADQLTSLTIVWRDICTLLGLPNTLSVLATVSCLPLYWRFMQCSRRYFDVRSRVMVPRALLSDGGTAEAAMSEMRMHLQNCGKYAAGVVAVLCRVGAVLHGTPAMWYFSLVVTSISALYSWCWDIFMDWSVFSPPDTSSCAPAYLSRNTIIRPRWAYGAAAAVDGVLRFVWIWGVVPASPLRSLSTEIVLTCFAVLEILRRSMWNVLRCENEHCTNCGRFRATVSMPMPTFAPAYDDDDDADDDADAASP